ncbi:MAG: TrkH family potassium uptake protein [Euryarchaeota archaeon]|nr:TrkH family potassium uptake protein [Euryarchaeota archaeon]
MHSLAKSNNNPTFPILHYTGRLCILLGLLMLVPIPVALIYNETNMILPFVYSAVISIIIGFILRKFFTSNTDFSLKGAMIFSAFVWMVLSALGALPFVFSGVLPSYLDAFFESMSGFTTTGFSMITNLDVTPYTINFWRGFTQWLGGIGIIVLALTILSSPGVHSMRMYMAEGREERILPSIRHTAKIIFYIYILYTVLGIILYIIAGAPVFDSVFYTFTTLSTGGFAMKNQSIAYYHSFPIELVSMILMLIGATNFALHYTVLKGNWREFFRNIEIRTAYPILTVATIITAAALFTHNTYGDFLTVFRYAVFQTVSAITTTGLQTTYPVSEIATKWGIGELILILLMIIGAGACSTGGGIKWSRSGLLIKGIWWQVKSFILPSKAVMSRKIHHITNIVITDEILRFTAIFTFTFIVIYILSLLIVAWYYNIADAAFETASAMSNVGLSVGVLSPTSPSIVKIVFIIDFWIGRLEIWPVLLFLAMIIRFTIKKRP